jgi:hypothetical protein
VGPPPPADPDIYWQITVAAPFEALNVVFLPGHMYRVRQIVYNQIQAQCDTAVIVPADIQML